MTELTQRIVTGVTLITLVIGTLFLCPPWVFAIVVAAFLVICLFYEWPMLVKNKGFFFLLLTPFYPVLPFLLIIIMQLTGYELINILLFALVGAFDTGAYMIGKKWGFHKIWASISPGKTWEGFAGGIVLASAVSFLFFWHIPIKIFVATLLPWTFCLCVSALCGDLFESFLKRQAGVKDSGSFFPGHGGILDRIDGILFATFIAFIFRCYLKTMLICMH